MDAPPPPPPPAANPQEFMVGGSADPGMSLQVQGAQPRRYSEASLMMQSGRDVEEERERMGHNLRER